MFENVTDLHSWVISRVNRVLFIPKLCRFVFGAIMIGDVLVASTYALAHLELKKHLVVWRIFTPLYNLLLTLKMESKIRIHGAMTVPLPSNSSVR